MLVKSEDLQNRYRTMETRDLLELAAEDDLADTARFLLNEELQERGVAPAIGELVETGRRRRRLHRTGRYSPNLWHRLIHLWGALLIPPLLYAAGWLHPAAVAGGCLLAWWLSARAVRHIWSAVPSEGIRRAALACLPLAYGLLYYGAYSLLYAHAQP